MKKLSVIAAVALLAGLSACGGPAGMPAAPGDSTNPPNPAPATAPATTTPESTEVPAVSVPPVEPAPVEPAPAESTAAAPASGITEAAAVDVALKHAKLAKGDVEALRSWLDRERRHDSYDVEFYHAETEYSYEIDAATGRIVECDVESYRSRGTAGSGKQISENQAMDIALKHAGIAKADAEWAYAEYDRDDGYEMYEVEWRTGTAEYDYEIDASNGDILGYSFDFGR